MQIAEMAGASKPKGPSGFKGVIRSGAGWRGYVNYTEDFPSCAKELFDEKHIIWLPTVATAELAAHNRDV